MLAGIHVVTKHEWFQRSLPLLNTCLLPLSGRLTLTSWWTCHKPHKQLGRVTSGQGWVLLLARTRGTEVFTLRHSRDDWAVRARPGWSCRADRCGGAGVGMNHLQCGSRTRSTDCPLWSTASLMRFYDTIEGRKHYRKKNLTCALMNH